MRAKEVSSYGKARLRECLPVVCSFWDVTQSQILGTSRLLKIVKARHSLRYFMSMNNDVPYIEIATLTNGDHSSVTYAVKTFLLHKERDVQYQDIFSIMNGNVNHIREITIETRLKEIIVSGVNLKQKVKLIKELNEN